MPDNSFNKRPLRPLKSVAGRAKNARPKAGRYRAAQVRAIELI
jgi:hypothetical protein